MVKLLILNTGGTFSQVPIDGTLCINEAALEDVNSEVSKLIKSFFPDPSINSQVTNISDVIYKDHWSEIFGSSHEPSTLDSSAMNPKHWNVLASIIHSEKEKRNFDAFVIIHGTDSLSFTAAALSFMLKNRSYPIVLTGSQHPLLGEMANGKRTLNLKTDAIRNIVEAIAAATYKHDGLPGGSLSSVYVSFSGKLMRGVHVVKVSSISDDAFDAPRFEPVGALNYASVSITGEYFLKLARETRAPPPPGDGGVYYACSAPLACMIVKIFPGVDISYLLEIKKLRSVLIVGLGSGNGPSDAIFCKVIRDLLNNNVFIAVASDCLDGDVLPTYSTSIYAIDRRIVPVRNMTTETAYAKILVILGNIDVKNDKKGLRLFRTRMSTQWNGEITLEDGNITQGVITLEDGKIKISHKAGVFPLGEGNISLEDGKIKVTYKDGDGLPPGNKEFTLQNGGTISLQNGKMKKVAYHDEKLTLIEGNIVAVRTSGKYTHEDGETALEEQEEEQDGEA